MSMRFITPLQLQLAMLFANIRELAFQRYHVKRKRREALGEGDWEAFENEELETMFQGLALSAGEDTGNESDASIDKSVHTPQGSEDDDDGTDNAQRALLNVDIVVGD
ncbi:hypothetical protein KIN20_019483 [Parelaphostrongylus tenuis]|uniref:Uncharacterized protein n=1 Tax=Parelaphostrongylus tenuis TaxID=148309 RepID=A0AAD5QQ83_PARTN|nr:hypothetical protein KIN20_019483 [Parelaphostrongylus tenuis]